MDSLARVVFFYTLVFSIAVGKGQNTFNVVDFGAKGDGQTDDSQAFLRAWDALCGATGDTSTLQIPADHSFLLKPLTFTGPCKSNNVHVQVTGTIIAPGTIGDWGECDSEFWLGFQYVTNLILDGSGTIDGQGSDWWKKASHESCTRPKASYFHHCNDLQLSGLTYVNSPKSHININSCDGVSISNIHINAPEDSPNTDGIDISESTHVTISSSFIGSGDDCIAINGGCSFINITDVTCGPGHGISVGSLGDHGVDRVEEVHVKHCTFTRTQNGARIKTWAGGSGSARKISFEDITLNAAGNPIIIDQQYCGGAHSCTEPSSVEVSEVTYNGFQGTSAKDQAITFNCSPKVACSGIVLDNINITSSVPGKQTVAVCTNAHGTSSSTTPLVPCLSGGIL